MTYLHDPHVAEAQHASGLNLIAGIWLFSSPWILGLSDGAAWNSYCAAIPLAVLASVRIAVPDGALGASWINFAIGIWLVLSPWLLGFSDQPSGKWNTAIVGALVLLVSLRSALATQHIHAVPLGFKKR